MRKVTFGVANSLDNFIARKNGGVDWLHWSGDVNQIMKEYWKKIDTIVVGRKTYDLMAKSGRASESGITTYVCSRTLKAKDHKNVTVVSEDPGRFVQKLKSKPGKEICVMCGGELARPLLEAGVIDEIGLNIHPVLLGSGIPLFYQMKRQIDLELKECRVLKGGCVYVTYRVTKRKGRTKMRPKP
jgi:dihydrofolate reductase